MTRTLLEQALAAMQATPGDEAARLAFFATLADSEVMLLLTGEAEGDRIEPELIEADGARFVLIFGSEERLTEFTGAPAHYATLSGRALAGMLGGEGLGLALNPGTEAGAVLLGAEELGWLAETLAPAPDESRALPRSLHAPDLPQEVVAAVDARLAKAAGLARAAWLAGVTWADDSAGHLLAITGAPGAAQPALARAISEVVLFSGRDLRVDVGFFAPDDPVIARLERVALRFDLPEPETPGASVRPAPGSDPEKPPILR